MPRVVKIRREKVRVTGPREAAEARGIFRRIEGVHQVELDSSAAAKKVRARGVKGIGKPVPWTLQDLRNLESGLKKFGPLVSCEEGGLATAAKLNRDEMLSVAESLEEDIAIYEEGDYGGAEHGPAEERELTITHELTHSLLEDRLDDFMQDTGYWVDEDNPTVETPPLPEGRTSAAADLRASFGVFLEQQTGSMKWLRDEYPARHQFFAQLYPHGVPAQQRAHAIQNIQTHTAAFMHAVPFWQTANQASVEVPPTRRAWDSGAEDMAECVSLYLDPAGRLTLKLKCPRRYASVARILAQETRAAVQHRRDANAPSQAELNARKLPGGRVLLPARIVGGRRVRQARR